MIPTDTKAFLQPVLSPPATSKKESEKVPSQVQTAKKSKSLKSVAAVDGVSFGHIDLMVDQLNKGIFGKKITELGGKSPEPVSFAAEATLGMIIVPTTGVFPDKVFCTKRTEEEFVICQVFRYSGVQLLYRCFF
jgi:hypothetical protein